MELEITWNRVIRVWWAHFWRNLIAIIVAMILGGIVGFILGLILGILKFESQSIKYVAFIFGSIIGLFISTFPMKMILGKDFGEFRLVLLSKTTGPGTYSNA